MWNKNVQGLLIVQQQELIWMTIRGSAPGTIVLRIPMDRLLGDPHVVQSLPPTLRGNNKTICIAPDHWFGMEIFPFQSRRSSLVEPFLARKLGVLHPEYPLIKQFFSYEWTSAVDGTPQLRSHFLNDEKAYTLWSTLLHVDQAPLRATIPALLWRDRLNREDPDFSRRGTLLVHLLENDCNLCFYSTGSHVFSRNVSLPDGPERLEVLAFEINQSLHLYSQRTKGDLARIYLQTDARSTAAAVAAQLGREVVDLDNSEPSESLSEAQAVPLLHGMLRQQDLLAQLDGLGIFHRDTRRALRWAPVQWYGIGLGSILAAGLAFELSFLGGVLSEERQTQQSLLRTASAEGLHLSEIEATAREVLQLRDRPTSADILSRLFSSLPRQMRIRETNLSLEGQPLLSVNATVQANSVEQLETLLKSFVARVKSQSKRLSSFSLNNIDVQPDPARTGSHYLVVFRIPLT